MDNKPECTLQSFITLMGQDLCDAAKECGSESFNFFSIRYCTLPQSTTGTVLFYSLMLLLLVMAFSLLGQIASSYLTPVLTKISLALNMSETLSGVTLLAFANGAPDIIASYSAAGAEGGIYITIGNLFGACLFCSTLVLGRCISVSPGPVKMERWQWLRDLVFYVLAALLLLCYGIIEKVNRWMVGMFFVIYFVYIAIVLYQDRQTQAQAKVAISEEGDIFKIRREADKKRVEDKIHKILAGDTDIQQSFVETLGDDGQIESKQRKLTITAAEVKQIYAKEFQQKAQDQPADTSQSEKILSVLSIPLKLLPTLTIPNLDEEESPRTDLIALTPLSACMLVCLLSKEFDLEAKVFGINVFIVGGSVGLIASALTFFLKREGNKAYEWVLVPFALVASIMWLKFSAGTVVDMIEYASVLFGLNKVLLGATVLGIGNSLADFFANSSLSASGYSVMACTGSIAGQLFNMLMSIPINLYKSFGENSEYELKLLNIEELKSTKIFALMIIWMVIMQLVFIMFSSIRSKFVLSTGLVKVNVMVYIGCYAIFLIMALALGKDTEKN